MAHVPACVYLIVWLTRLNCVGGDSDASSATNWQPNTGARTNTHTIHTYYAFLRLRFQFDFRKFQQQQEQHLRFACFRLFQTCSLCYIFCLFYVCLRRHTHTDTRTHAQAHTHRHGCCSARFAAGILRAFCSCAASAAPATRLLQRQTEATRQQQQQHQLQQQQQQLAHAPTVLLSLVPII